jgi:hypothetical protein
LVLPVEDTRPIVDALADIIDLIRADPVLMQAPNMPLICWMIQLTYQAVQNLHVAVPAGYDFNQWITDVTNETHERPEAFGRDFITLLDMMVGANK